MNNFSDDKILNLNLPNINSGVFPGAKSSSSDDDQNDWYEKPSQVRQQLGNLNSMQNMMNDELLKRLAAKMKKNGVGNIRDADGYEFEIDNGPRSPKQYSSESYEKTISESS